MASKAFPAPALFRGRNKPIRSSRRNQWSKAPNTKVVKSGRTSTGVPKSH